MSFGLGIFHVDVFPDGTRFTDVCAAISAAWLADHPELAEQIAREYGLYNAVCLRCASKHISFTAGRSRALEPYGERAFQLCDDCRWFLSGPRRRAMANPHGEISH